MMKRLFYIRHGQTDHNINNIWSGRIEALLTEAGIRQASAAGRQAKSDLPRIDLIICSPLQRTKHTAQLVAKELHYPEAKIKTNQLLLERSFGALEGLSTEEFKKKYDYRDIDSLVEGAESIEALDKRAAKALEYIKSLPEDNILVVGHGSFGRALRRAVQGLPHTHEYEAFLPINNAEIIELI